MDAIATNALPPMAPETARTLRYSIIEGSATTIFFSWTSGAVLMAYLLYMGATPFQLSIAGCVPFLAQASAPAGGFLLALFPRPKLLTTLLAMVGRVLWLLPALLPMFYLGGDGAANYFLLLLMVSWFIQASAGPVWSTWMSRVVPGERRGRYFGLRNGICAVVGLGANMVAGLVLDALHAPASYQVLIFAGTIFALVGVGLLQTHHEPVIDEPGRVMRPKEMFIVPLRDKNFRRYLALASFWTTSVLLGMSLFIPYLIQYIGMNFLQIAIFQAIVAISVLISGPLWGRMADKYGNRSVLAINIFMAGTLPMTCWILARPGDLFLVYLGGFFEGIAGGAIGAAMFNLSLVTAPEKHRPAYLGLLALIAGVIGFVGGSMAGPLLGVFQQMEFTIREVEFGAWQWLFFFSAIGRIASSFLVRSVRESHSWRTRDVIRVFIPWRLLPFGWRG